MNSKDLEKKLESLLKKYQEHIDFVDLSQVDGFFTAICCAKEVIPPSKWLPTIWNKKKGEPNWKSTKESELFYQTFIQYYNFVLSMLSDKSFVPIIHADDNEKPILLVWCLGFSSGKDLWSQVGDADNVFVEENIELIHQHSELLAAEFHNKSSLETLENHYRIICKNIQLLFNYFEKQRALKSDHAPFRIDEPKMSRNDPCPCGSGEKFKKCCLH